jgi:hypothetical protein
VRKLDQLDVGTPVAAALSTFGDAQLTLLGWFLRTEVFRRVSDDEALGKLVVALVQSIEKELLRRTELPDAVEATR